MKRMKGMKKAGVMPTAPPGIGGMGGPPTMRPPMIGPPVATTPIRRPPVMKAKGMPLAGFAPAAKKARKGKKVRKGQKQFAI